MKQLLLSLLLFVSACCYAQQPNPKTYTNKMQQQNLLFMENMGQVANAGGQLQTNVLFTAKGNGAQLWLTATGISYQFTKTDYPAGYNAHDKKTNPVKQQELLKQAKQSTHRFTVQLVGSNPQPKVVKEKQGNYTENYYLAHCPQGITGVKSFEKITYKNVYPNIDWVIYSNGGYLEYDFIVHPGGNPAQIKLRVNDADKVTLTNNGELLVKTRLGEVREKTPISYNEAGKPIATRFVMHKDGSLGFAGAFPVNKTLRIDPEVVWATYYGGSNIDSGLCTLDNSGNVYLAGETQSSSGIASGGYDNTYSSSTDLFLAKFSSNGSRLWATYYGGTAREIMGACKTDSSGNVYLAGSTQSTTMASGGFDNVFSGGASDGFLAKFNSAGTRLWATYYGGTIIDYANACTVDSADNVYLAGFTNSTAGIASDGFQSALGGESDGYLVKFSSSGARLWGTYFGGISEDEIVSIATDSSNNVFATGYTYSSDNIASSGSYLTAAPGDYHTKNTFLAKFSSSGSRLWTTYYGGAGYDSATGCTVDNNGNVYINGVTDSTDGIGIGGFQNTISGTMDDAYLAKFSTSGSLLWSTYYGGSGSEGSTDAKTDSAGNIYLAGSANSAGLASNGFQNIINGGTDGLIVKFDSSGARLWSSYYGGEDTENIYSCAVDGTGTIYVSGWTRSTSGISLNGFQNSVGGGGNSDSFLARIYDENACDTPAPTAVAQSVIAGSTIASLIATGSNLQWYTDNTGGTALPADTAVTAGTYYVSQTVAGCESPRTAVSVTTTTCGAPIEVTALVTSPTTANLSWRPNPFSTPTNYQYHVSTSATPPASGTSLSLITVNNFALTANTTYYLHVRSNCSGSYSEWVTSAPFRGALVGDTCATALNLTALTSPYYGTTAGATADYSIACANGNASPDQFFYIDVPNGATIVIGQTFNNYDSENYVGYGGSCPGTNRIACFDNEDIQNVTWTNTTGSQQRVYWVQDGYSVAGNAGRYTLEWSLTGATSSCAAPTALTGVTTSATTANLSWTAPAGTPTGYQYAVTTLATPPASGITVTGTFVNAYVITPGTRYYLHVRTNCNGTFSNWTTSEQFFTPPPPGDTCDTAINLATLTSPYSSTLTGAYNDSFFLDCTLEGPDLLYYIDVLQGQTLVIGLTARGSFDSHNYVGYGGTCPGTTTIISCHDDPDIHTTTWTNSTGSTQRVYWLQETAFATSDGTFTLTWSVTGGCAPPLNLRALPTSLSTARLSWAPPAISTPTGYQYAVTTSSTAPASGTNTTATSVNSYSFPAFENYYLHVRTNCSGSYSSWVTTGPFTGAIYGDSCYNAIDLATITSPHSNTTEDADPDYGIVCDSRVNQSQDLYYYLAVPNGATLTIGLTSSDYDSVVSVKYGDGSCPGYYSIACFDSPDIQNIIWTNTTGTTQTVYWIQGGHIIDYGNFTLAWSLTGGTAACNPPATATATVTSATTVNLNWTASTSGAPVGYQYAVTTSAIPPASGTVFPTTSVTGYTITAGTTYYLHVRTYCNGTYSNWTTSAPFAGTTGCTTPAPTASAQTLCNGNTVANLTATGTALKWYTAATGGTALATTTSLVTRTYYVSQTLNGCEGPRAAVAVNIITVTVPNVGEITYDYNATVANLPGTDYRYYTTATGGTPLPATTPLTTAVYYVSRYTSGCESARGTVSVTIVVSCGDTEGLTGTATSSTTALLNWSSPPIGATTGYQTYISTSVTPPAASLAITVNTNIPSISLSSLIPNTTYYYWVRTICGNNAGTWTTGGSFTTPAIITPGCTTAVYGLFPTTTYNPICTGSRETITTSAWPGEYSRVNVVANRQYTFSTSVATDYITITNASGTILAYGTSGIVWNSGSYSGTINYYLHTNSACGNVQTIRSRYIFCAMAPSCTAPTNISVVPGLGLTTVSWTAPTDSTPVGYQIIWSTVNSAPVNVSPTTDLLTNTSVGLGTNIPSTIFYYWLRTVCSSGTSDWVSGWFLTPACGNPSNITTVSVSSTSANVAWAAPSTVPAGYQMYASVSSTTPSASLAITTDTTNTTGTFSNLALNTTYYYWIRSVCGTSAGQWIVGGNFTTPATPGCLNATYGQYPTATTFTPACTGLDEAIVNNAYAGEYTLVNLTSRTPYTLSSYVTTDYITISNEAGTAILAAGNSPLTYTPLTSGVVRYYFHTNSLCGETNVGRVKYIRCNATSCDAPTALAATNITPNTAQLTWTRSLTTATNFQFYTSTSPVAPLDSAAAIPATGLTFTGNTVLSGSITGLTTNTTYYYWVRNICGNLNSPWVAGGSFTTLAQVGCNVATYGVYPTATFFASCTGTQEIIATNSYAGEYSNIRILSNTQYSFTSSVPTDFITITNDTGAVLFASGTSGTSGISWFSGSFIGTVRYYMHTNSSCGDERANRIKYITCNQCSGITAPTASAQTFCNSATVANLTATGTALKWYSVATGGTPLDTTAALATGTYYVSQTLNTCESPRAGVTVTVNTTPIPAAADQEVCNRRSTVANLTATGTALKWYTTATGGAPLSSSASLSTRTYYVSQTLNGCESARNAISVTIFSTPAPTASNQTFCNGATVADLTATGTGLKWYTVNQDTVPLAAATPLISGRPYYVTQTINGCESNWTEIAVTINSTPLPSAASQVLCNGATVANLTATGTNLKWYDDDGATVPLTSATALSTHRYYVTQTINGCESSRVQIAVTINTTAVPTAPDQLLCSGATVAGLTATGTNLKWYATFTGGTQLATATALTSGTYYVSQTLNGCESTRNAISVTINNTVAPTASAQTFCNGATVANLTATGTSLKWYTTATGGTALASTAALATGTYYVSQTQNSCESTRTGVAVTINNTTAPTASAQAFCNGATVASLTATGIALKWYTTATGGTALASTATISTRSYYVSQTVNSCESARTAVAVTVNTTPVPSAPDQVFCNAATVANLTATGTNLKWYAALTGGTQLATTTALSSGTYYVSQTLNSCESTRNAISVTVTTTPPPTASAQTFCNQDLVTIGSLTATGTNLKWYWNATGGTELDPSIEIGTRTFYVSQTINGCESTRTAVDVEMNNPSAPIIAAQTFCNGATAAAFMYPGSSFKVYTTATGGTALTANTALSTRTYYISDMMNDCESQRTAVSVTVTNPTAPTASAQTFCNSGTVANLVATGTSVKWYATATGGTALTATTALATGTYYVSQTLNSCESTRTGVSITINNTTAPTASAQTFCNGGTAANLVATGTSLKWYATATGGTALTATTVLATGTYYVSQTLNSCESTRTGVSVTINNTTAPTASAQIFCNGGTVANLVATGTSLKWYATATGGTQLASTATLATGTYYVSQTLNSCESTRTGVSVTINNTTAPTASAQTFCNGGTVANLVASGTSLKWYSVATGGTALTATTALATGTYYVSQTLNSCETSRTSVAITINNTTAPTASAQTFCNGATVASLTATGTSLKWYATATGGTQLASTATLATGTYYVSQTLNSCESTRTSVAVIINNTTAPTASAQTFCNGGTVANLVATGTSLKWYSVATGGTALTATTALATGTYYVSQTLNSCESTRTGVSVTINNTTAPTASAQIFCNGGTVANLVATGTSLKWYASATGGTALTATTALATGTYYVSQTLSSCESTRTSVAITINNTTAPTASAQTFCNGGTVANLVATGTSLKWYATATGGTQLASTATLATGTYYVSQTLNSCESTRTGVAVTINNTTAPTASAQTFCNGGTVANLVATGTSLKWYATTTGGTALTATTALATGTYYVSQTLSSCESTRTSVAVTINTTTAPTASAQTFCNGGTVANLVATGTSLKWYSVVTGGTALTATTALATGAYYVSQTLNSCESTRTSVAVTINNITAPTALAQTFCNGGTVANLVATGTSLKWYATATGGTALTATTALAMGTYYVSQTLNSCESTRTSVAVTVNRTSAPTASAQAFCNGATLASLTATGTSLKWYSVATGGTALTATTALATAIYYVSQTLNSCESTRTSVAVTVTNPAAPIASAQTLPEGSTVANLAATGTGLQWYSVATGGTALASPAVLANGTYYVSQTINGCESTRTAVVVTIAVTAPPAPAAVAQTFCNSATVANLTATGTGLKWYMTLTGGTALSTTTAVATGTYYVSQTINSVESTRTSVAVAINRTTPPTASAQTFCISATVANLTATGTSLKWYSVATGGTALTAITALANGTYYVSQTLNSCESTRTAVSVLIYSTDEPATSAQIFCAGATVADLSATGTDLKWYVLATGGTQLPTTATLATGTYYVTQTLNSCESWRRPVSITIYIPTAPIASAQAFCSGATVASLVATGTDIKWYATATGGTQLASTTALATGTYYASQTLNCESTRTAVSVIINTTAAPTASAQTFCNSGTVANLVATGTSLKWYSVATGGTELVSTATLATGTYYVSQTLNSCESTRTSVAVTINNTTAPTASAQAFCNGATVASLTATGASLIWYATATGGTQLASTATLATGTYYVSQTLNSCESTRTSVSITINNTTAPTASAQTFCNAVTVANLVATGTSLKWYSVATGGTALTATTALATGTYYVSQTLNSCESTRTSVAVTINTTTAPTASAQAFCNGATVASLTATGASLKWYATATGGTALTATTALATGTYYVSQTLNSCESTRTGVAVAINNTTAPTASAQTFCTGATVTQLSATGTGLVWYADATGGSALVSTEVLSTGTYYVSQTLNACESVRTSVAVTINNTTAPTASAQTFCNGGTVANLVASGTSVKWYAAATGGTALTATTALATGTYYVSQTLNSCESTRTAVSVIINTTAAPIASAQAFCNSATVASLTATGASLKWYSVATGGTALTATTTLATGTYYVSQTLNSCESTRTGVAVAINNTTAPTALAQTFCNGGTVASLVATGTSLKWYSVATGGTALTATTALATGIYYVSQTLNSCESVRTGVAVTINNTIAPTASAQTFCNAATVANLVASGTSLKWYSVATGGTALTATTALATGTYYVSQTLNSCESTRTSVAVTVTNPAAPIASAQTLPEGSTVANLAATGTGLQWYSVATGGTALASPAVLANGTYYVSQTINGCESTRTAVVVTIAVTAPPAPSAVAQTFCNSATVADLDAIGTDLKWYTTLTGGTALSATTAVATGTYYVSQTINGVESTRTSVAVTVNRTSAPTASAQAFCNGATVASLTATGTSLKWYSVATGGTALTATTALATGTYYVSQTLNSCESARTGVAVTINNTLAPTAVAQTFCNGGTVANLVATGTSLKWYSVATGGTALTATTALATGTYYVSQTLNSCESTRTSVAVIINNTTAPTASAQTFCNGGTVANLVATGTSLKWYSVATGGTALTATTALATGTYYVSQTLNSCESARTGVAVTINNTLAPTAVAQTFCNGGTVANLVATGTSLKWHTTATGGTALTATTALATGTYYVSQTLNSCESTRTSVAVTINNTTAPTASAQTFCNGGTVANLVATGTSLKWYTTATGGTAITATTALATGTYYVSQTLNSCESTRTSVAVTVTNPAAPIASAQTLPEGSTVANLAATGTGLQWYNVATGGTALASSAVLANGTYYVSQTINGCESTRTVVVVTIAVTAPPAPSAVAQTFCNSATVADLDAIGTNLKWYTTLTGGTALSATTAVATGTYYVSQTINGVESTRTSVAVTINRTTSPTAIAAQTFCLGATVADLTATGTNLTWYSLEGVEGPLPLTASLTSDTYFVTQTINGCESISTPVIVTINNTTAPTASAQTFCNGATVANLTASGTSLKWYSVATGGTALTATTALATGTYYVSQTLNACESVRTAVSVIINTTTAPSATEQTFCTGATVAQLSATGTNLVWYADATSTTTLASTEVLARGTYYVSQTLNSCESTRTAVSVIINTTPAPIATEQTFCTGATVAQLSATGTGLVWYADATGTTALASTEVLATGTYYVSQTLNACESVRTAVSVIINTTTAPTATEQTFCTGATVAQLSAAGTGLVWYADATGTTALASTEVLATGTYYVSQTLNACESVRTAVSVIINTTAAPTATEQTFCTGATVAQLSATGTGLVWYADATGTTALASSEVLATGTYYVSQTLNACESVRTAVSVIINTTPAPTATEQTFCTGATVAQLSATGTGLVWYADATGTTALASTEVLATGTYYVSQTLNACESVRTAVSVIINTTAAPTATEQTFCTGATVAQLSATGTGLAWYADATSGSALASTEVLATGTYYVSQTLNNCESIRTAVSVVINTTAAPTAFEQTFCTGATVAQLSATGTGLVWYADAIGTTALASTEVLATGTYYVSQTLNACESVRTAVSVIINTTTAPTAFEQTFCTGATVAQLSGTGTGLLWYADATSTTALTSTEVLSTGTYYVSQTLNACESVRTAVGVIINTTAAPTATEQTFCTGATVAQLSATGTGLVWYADATGTTALTSTEVLATGTYYVSQTLNACESVRTAVSVIINTTAAPIATEQTFCTGATVAQLSATGTNLVWYADATGTTALASTEVIATGTYYVSQTLNACESVRTAVSVIINTTAAPTATEQTFCTGATVAQLSATGTGLVWYADATGTTALASTEVLATGTYYVSQTLNACESVRTAVSVIINTTAAPIATEQTFCTGATVSQLSATGTNLIWYADATGTTALASSEVLATGTYYVSQTQNACESVRTAVSVIINTTPAPEGAPTQAFIITDNATIANISVIGEGVLWYASEAEALGGGTPLPLDTVLENGVTYYATQTVNGCTSTTTLAVTISVLLGDKDVVKETFKYYPNPVVSELNIESSNLISNVAVYDLNGKLVMNVVWNTNKGKVNMSLLETATYLVRVTTGNTVKNLTIIKK